MGFSRAMLSELSSAKVGKMFYKKYWECRSQARFISCRAQFSVCFKMPSVKIIVPESAPGPFVSIQALRL